jgi:hypothetical protein
MGRPRDLQIWWIVIFAGGFWAAIWEHEEVTKLSKSALNAVLAVTSNLRGAPPPQASPADDSNSGKLKHPASKAAPKGQESAAKD